MPRVAKATMIRMPEAMWDQLTDRAREQGVSANQLMVILIAAGIGFKLGEQHEEEQ